MDENTLDEMNMDGTGNENLPAVSDVTVEPYEEKPLSGFLEDTNTQNGTTDKEEISENNTDGVEKTPGDGESPQDDGISPADNDGNPRDAQDDGGNAPDNDAPAGEGSGDNPEGPKDGPDSPDGPKDPEEKEIKPPSRRVLIFIAVLLALIAAAAVAVSLFVKDRNKPAERVEQFLDYARELDFEGMQSCLKSGDVSALDGTDLMDETYDGFFREMSEQLTYDIVRVRIHHQDGTAQVTAHITYVDASQVYKQTVSEFLSRMVDATLDNADTSAPDEEKEETAAAETKKEGPAVPDTESEEVQETLLRMLTEKAEENDTVFSEAEIMYPMILENGEWKIISLDSETVRVLAGNSSGIENEIRAAVAGIDPDSQAAAGDEAVEPAGFEITTENYTIRHTGHEIGEDFAGNPCLKLFYEYTNHSEFPSSPLRDVSILVFQHGKKCPAAIPAENRNDIDSFYAQAEEGETISVCQIFSLSDLSTVMIQIDGDDLVSDTLTLNPSEEEE